MNKKLNLVLNITEIFSILIIAISMIVLARVSISGLNTDLLVLRRVLLVSSVLAEVFVITSEALLFIVYKKNIKYMYIAYMIGEIALAVLVNMYIPFSGLLVVGILELIKFIIRITNIVKIYDKKLFNRYCKLFNVKLSTVSTRKTTKKKTTRKRVTTTARKQVKSYA